MHLKLMKNISLTIYKALWTIKYSVVSESNAQRGVMESFKLKSITFWHDLLLDLQ